MPRADISPQLVHFTSGDTDEEAFARLCRIVDERRLVAGNGKIKGGYFCVCFTEAPLPSLPGGLVNPTNYSRYKPFGVMFDKAGTFERGGRPVIYQADAEFEQLPVAMRWRHVRHEPHAVAPIDFSWEREWRLPVPELPLDPSYATLVLPDETWVERLSRAFDEQQDWLVAAYADVVGKHAAQALREDFRWQVTHVRRDEVWRAGIEAA